MVSTEINFVGISIGIPIDISFGIPMLKPKPKSEFRFRHPNRNQNFGESKHQNSDEIRLQFCRNFDFVESKKRTFVETIEGLAYAQINPL
jgi:hypothetical protein